MMPDNAHPISYEELLEELVAAISASGKYRSISPDLVRQIGIQELLKRKSLKEAIKATKSMLHQVGGAYLSTTQPYQSWLAQLQQAAQHGRAELQLACRQIMRYHASTSERLPLLDDFYITLFKDLPPVSSVLDLACGLHPLSIPWMPLATDTVYYACDIYQDMMNFLQSWLDIIHMPGSAFVCNIAQSCPTYVVDVAFVLKTLPCLAQLDKHISLRLLKAINARAIVVSYPLHSLGGRKKGMLTHYEQHFQDMLRSESWFIMRYEFSTELVFVIKK